MRAFLLFLLKLALYARGDSNPQPLAPEANDVLFTSGCFYSTYINFQKSWVRFGCENVFKTCLICTKYEHMQLLDRVILEPTLAILTDSASHLN